MMSRYSLVVGALGGSVFLAAALVASFVTDRFDPFSLVAAALVAVGFAVTTR